MMRLNPDATFDCLFVANRLQIQRSSFSVQEVHLFTYLACLLWLYREMVVSDWGYEFVGTELGAPFSRDIDTALKELLERGYFRRIHDRVRLTELAEQPLRVFSELTINQERAECLQAACSSTALFSVGMVSNALAKEPELMRAKALPSSRLLLEDSARSQLYVQFDALRKAVSQRSNDLRLPAIVWLTALYRFGEGET
ncbi:MAG: hypothetical protein V1754_06340 [Pseudomonadota bacterium]